MLTFMLKNASKEVSNFHSAFLRHVQNQIKVMQGTEGAARCTPNIEHCAYDNATNDTNAKHITISTGITSHFRPTQTNTHADGHKIYSIISFRYANFLILTHSMSILGSLFWGFGIRV